MESIAKNKPFNIRFCFDKNKLMPAGQIRPRNGPHIYDTISTYREYTDLSTAT